MATKNSALEIQTCSRCHGSGSYSYNQIDGSRCFKCSGSGVVHTKRGSEAHKFLENLRSVPMSTLVVGDTFRFNDLSRTFFVAVESIENKMSKGSVNGVPYEHEMLEISGTWKDGRYSMMGGDNTMVRKGWSAEEKAAHLAQALVYQETLTQQGTPRKR